MKIEFSYDQDGCMLTAVYNGLVVARAHAPKIGAAVKALISQFAEMQAATIGALNDSGIIHYVPAGEQEKLS